MTILPLFDKYTPFKLLYNHIATSDPLEWFQSHTHIGPKTRNVIL